MCEPWLLQVWLVELVLVGRIQIFESLRQIYLTPQIPLSRIIPFLRPLRRLQIYVLAEMLSFKMAATVPSIDALVRVQLYRAVIFVPRQVYFIWVFQPLVRIILFVACLGNVDGVRVQQYLSFIK